MPQDSKSRKLDQYIVRFPDGLRDRVKQGAEANNRSMNAEIVAALEEKYPAPAFTSEAEDLVREWQPRIIAEADPEAREKLVREANRLLGEIWLKGLENEADADAYETRHRAFKSIKLKL